MWCSNKVTALHAGVSGSTPGRARIFNKRLFLFGTRRGGGTKSQLLASVPNTPGLNPKSLHSTYDMKVFIQFIVIRPFDGDVKFGGPLGASRKEKANAGTGFHLHSYSSHINHSHKIPQNNTYRHTLILSTFPNLQLHILQYGPPKWSQFHLYLVYSGAQMLNLQ